MKRTLAVPNGSLYEATSVLLAKVGMRVVINGRKFEARLEGSDIFDRAIIMRPQDMPEALIDGMADAAIYGYDWHMEVGLGDQLAVITELNYSKKTSQPVKLIVFGRQGELIDEEGVLVTTEYPRLTAQLFKRATIRFSHGGTEQKVAYGKYDYGVCVTETGESLRENGLAIVKTILVSPTVLVAKEDTPEIRYFGELLMGGLRAARLRLLKMNVSRDILPEVLQLLPALEAPTVNQLSNGDFAVETVVSKDQVANLIVGLRGKGVNGILSQEIDIVC
jgi:ATP phosphoribosyltransferase